MSEPVKFCPRCGQTRCISEFFRNRNAKDGLQAWCKLCMREEARRNYAKRKELGPSAPTVASKRCSDCDETKPASEFHRERARKDGLQRLCKACRRARSRDWLRANAERARENMRRWRAANAEKQREYNKLWRQKNKDKVRAYETVRRARQAEIRS